MGSKKTTKNLLLPSVLKVNSHKRFKRGLLGKALVAYKETLFLTDILKCVLVGTLLGDASISCRLGKPVFSVKYEQKATQEDYIYHLYQIWQAFVGTPPQMRTIENSFHKMPGKSYWFRTYSHICLKEYYDLFYPINNGNRRVKRVPTNIDELLTPRALAYWYMDDGNIVKRSTQKGTFYSYKLNTQGFCRDDQFLLIDALKTNFGVTATIEKDTQKGKTYLRLVINGPSATVFLNTVKEFIVPSFLYKLGE